MPEIQKYKCSVCKKDKTIFEIEDIHAVLDYDDLMKYVVICKECNEQQKGETNVETKT